CRTRGNRRFARRGPGLAQRARRRADGCKTIERPGATEISIAVLDPAEHDLVRPLLRELMLAEQRHYDQPQLTETEPEHDVATAPQFLPPPPEPAPLSPVPVVKPATPRRRMGILGIVVISALVGALAGTAAAILVAPRLIKVAPTSVGGGGIGPLAPITNNVT